MKRYDGQVRWSRRLCFGLRPDNITSMNQLRLASQHTTTNWLRLMGQHTTTNWLWLTGQHTTTNRLRLTANAVARIDADPNAQGAGAGSLMTTSISPSRLCIFSWYLFIACSRAAIAMGSLRSPMSMELHIVRNL